MKTITIKLPEAEAEQLELYLEKRHYPSKSEFIRNLIMEKMELKQKEKLGWLVLAEKSMDKLWKNKKDDNVWGKYL